MPELNQVISLQDLAPSTLVDGAPSDVSQDVPDSTRQGSPSFNSLSMVSSVVFIAKKILKKN